MENDMIEENFDLNEEDFDEEYKQEELEKLGYETLRLAEIYFNF